MLHFYLNELHGDAHVSIRSHPSHSAPTSAHEGNEHNYMINTGLDAS